MGLSKRPSCSPRLSGLRDALAFALALSTTTACQPKDPSADFDEDGILIGVALADNQRFPEDFCIENLDVPGPEGTACMSISIEEGADYNYIEENGVIVLANNFNGELIYVFRVPFDGFGESNTLSFSGIPEGWQLYDGPLGTEPMNAFDVNIPSAKHCYFSGDYCTMPLDNKNNIFVLKASGDAIE